MTDRKVGGLTVKDRRPAFHMEDIQALAELHLERLYPGIYRRADKAIDEIIRQLYDAGWREYRAEIIADIRAYADLHPADQQRSERSIKDWSAHCGGFLEDDYGQSYYRVAVHVGLLGYVTQMRELRQHMHCEHGWHRIIERFVDSCGSQPSFGFIEAGEKWGSLSLTYRCDEASQEICRPAEKIVVERSLETCEICGLVGHLRKFSWWKTLCDRHYLDRLQVLTDDEGERLHVLYLMDKDHSENLIAEYAAAWDTTEEMIENLLTLLHDRPPELRLYSTIQIARAILERRDD